jgi:phosphotransferase system  glucose/maltose/N-acetylglucosamine-specific IIC component
MIYFVMDIHTHFNFIEGIFWITVGVLVFIYSFKAKVLVHNIYYIGSVLLIVFVLSDFVEIHSGAWWRPWWLLIWKGVCLAGFAVLGIYVLIKKNSSFKEKKTD